MEKSKNQGSGHLIRSTRKELHLPDDMLLFHFIHTKYYYPDGRDFPGLYAFSNSIRNHGYYGYYHSVTISVHSLNRITYAIVLI